MRRVSAFGDDALGDLEVRHLLLQQANDLPAVRQRLQLGDGAEVAEEAFRVVAIAQDEEGVGEIVEAGELLDRLARGLLGSCLRRRHVSMLAR